MRYFSTLLVILATSTTLLMAAPTPQVVDEDANERADDGAKAVENELKIQESIALQQAGCFGGVIEGAECEKIDADFQAKIAAALGTDDDAAADDAAADDAAADQGNNNNNNNNNGNNQGNNNQNNNNQQGNQNNNKDQNKNAQGNGKNN